MTETANARQLREVAELDETTRWPTVTHVCRDCGAEYVDPFQHRHEAHGGPRPRAVELSDDALEFWRRDVMERPNR